MNWVWKILKSKNLMNYIQRVAGGKIRMVKFWWITVKFVNTFPCQNFVLYSILEVTINALIQHRYHSTVLLSPINKASDISEVLFIKIDMQPFMDITWHRVLLQAIMRVGYVKNCTNFKFEYHGDLVTKFFVCTVYGACCVTCLYAVKCFSIAIPKERVQKFWIWPNPEVTRAVSICFISGSKRKR